MIVIILIFNIQRLKFCNKICLYTGNVKIVLSFFKFNKKKVIIIKKSQFHSFYDKN